MEDDLDKDPNKEWSDINRISLYIFLGYWALTVIEYMNVEFA